VVEKETTRLNHMKLGTCEGEFSLVKHGSQISAVAIRQVAAVPSISALRFVGATTYSPECSRLLRCINVCTATNDFAVCDPVQLAVLDQVRLGLRLGSFSKVVVFISSIVIAERALYSASPACPSSGYCRSAKRPGDAKAKDYLHHWYCPSKCQRWNNVMNDNAWAISWKDR
jgi:hypothetical protein